MRRNSLPPPPKQVVTFEEYLNPIFSGHLGRPVVEKDGKKEIKAVIAMVRTFSFLYFFNKNIYY